MVYLKFLCLVFFSLGAQANPLILVHGGGPHFIVSLKDLKRRLVAQGVPEKGVHLFWYDFRRPLLEIELQLKAQWQQLKPQYPAETKFDVVSHSLGHFLAMYMWLRSGEAERVERYIGIAGVARGQEITPQICERVKCPDFYQLLNTKTSSFVPDFLRQYELELRHWKKCSLYSLDDRNLHPVDAGVFDDGIKIEVSGLGHLRLVHSDPVVELLLHQCWN